MSGAWLLRITIRRLLSHGLSNHCDEPRFWTVGEILLRIWIRKTLAASLRWYWFLRIRRLQVSFGLLPQSDASWTPDAWFAGQVVFTSRWIASPAAHYWTVHEHFEPAVLSLSWHPLIVCMAYLLLFISLWPVFMSLISLLSAFWRYVLAGTNFHFQVFLLELMSFLSSSWPELVLSSFFVFCLDFLAGVQLI